MIIDVGVLHAKWSVNAVLSILIGPVFQSIKPRTGVFCMLIQEVRETSALEMPDRENTFVMKGDGPLEYVIEAGDATELRLWLHAIQQCLTSNTDSVSSEELAAM